MINKKFIKIILIALFVFFLTVLVIVFWQRNDNQKFTKQDTPFKMSPVLYNVQSHWINKDKLVFYSGHSFASVNLVSSQTGTTSLDLPFLAPAMNNIIWTNYGVFINYSDYVPLDGFYEELTSHNLSTDVSYWWYFSFSDKRWAVLPQLKDTENIAQQSEETILFSSKDRGDTYRQSVVSFDLRSREQSIIKTVNKNITSLHANNDRLIVTGNTFNDDVSLLSLSLQNKKEKDVPIGKGVAATSCNQRITFCSIALNNSNERTLEETTEDQGEISTHLSVVSINDAAVIKNFKDVSSSNSPSWNDSFLAFRVGGSNSYKIYDSNTTATLTVSLKRNYNNLYVIKSKNQKYLLGVRGDIVESSKRGSVSTLNQRLKDITNTDNIIVDEEGRRIIIQFSQTNHKASIEAAIDDLFIYNIDPNQIDIGFSMPNTTREPLPLN